MVRYNGEDNKSYFNGERVAQIARTRPRAEVSEVFGAHGRLRAAFLLVRSRRVRVGVMKKMRRIHQYNLTYTTPNTRTLHKQTHDYARSFVYMHGLSNGALVRPFNHKQANEQTTLVC